MTTSLLALNVKLIEAASLAALETAVNAFLKGTGSPAAQDNWQLIDSEFFYAAGAGNPYIVILTYSGN